MTKEFWINLPVKDVNRSKDFFTQIGFSFDMKINDGHGFAAMHIGAHKTPVMLFPESVFEGFVKSDIADTRNAAEVLFSIDADSRAEVDEIAKKVKAAGGIVYGEPSEIQGWMYGCGFIDPDGHRWNILYRDMK